MIMKTTILLFAFFLAFSFKSYSQFYVDPLSGKVSIGNIAPTEALDITGTARIRTIAQDNTLNMILGVDVTGKIFWRNSTTLSTGWSLNGNSGTVDVTNFIGTVDAIPLNFRVNNQMAGRIDHIIGSTLLGYQAGNNSIPSSNSLTGVGYQALFSNTTGQGNNAYGYQALFSTSTGIGNVADGGQALFSNTIGNGNTAVGSKALFSNVAGSFAVAIGWNAMQFNNTSSTNTNVAVGFETLKGSLTVSANTGNGNTAVGYQSLTNTTSGNSNAAFGASALNVNTIGNNNTALGSTSGPNLNNLSNTTALGYGATTTASNSVRIGNSSVTSIGGQVAWSTLSDGRFKRDIKEDVSGLSFIKQLRPVSYSLDNEAYDSHVGIINDEKVSQARVATNANRYTGFVAQEVESIVNKFGLTFSGVETPKNDKDTYSIRYSDFVVPLVKAVQELTSMVEKQQSEIESFKNGKVVEQSNAKSDGNSSIILYQNSPNPFKVETEIRMLIPTLVKNSKLYVYDMQGKPLTSFDVKERGNSSVRIEGGFLTPGLYLYALVADGQVIDVKKMILTE
jgi:trimeric autotransporter adhesin